MSASSSVSGFVPVQLIVPTSAHNLASLLTELHPGFQTFCLACQDDF